MQQQIQYGIDILLQQHAAYKNKRIAFVTNNAAFNSTGELSRAALLKKELIITKLFSPEHGMNTAMTDGAFVQHETDSITGLPIISLYGEQLAPLAKDLQEIDLVLFDIPDIGCRFYTYLWTLTHVMEACAALEKPLLILDRPNPIGTDLLKAEGPMLDEENCSSFIGRWNIPLKHSCTLGELALYFAANKINGLNLNVIKVQNYNRQQSAADFFFTPTSPAIQNIETAMLYPGSGLLEGINVNEGRGTEKPFCICGAPWMNNDELKKELDAKELNGIAFSIISYKPISGMYAHENCSGVQLHITDVENFYAIKTGLALLQSIIKLHPKEVQERLYKTNANPAGTKHLDKLLGVQNAFTKLQQGENIKTEGNEEWTKTMKPYLLY